MRFSASSAGWPLPSAQDAGGFRARLRQLPERAAVIAVATAIVESHLQNLTSGDRDSLGLFQQRPSQGWGTPEHILNPTLAAGTFYQHLLAIPGWDARPVGGWVRVRVVEAAQPPRRAVAQALGFGLHRDHRRLL